MYSYSPAIELVAYKEGTYRAFIWEPGSVIIIPLVEDEESIYRESSESFTGMLLYGDYDFNIGFNHSGGMKAVERVLRWGVRRSYRVTL